ncbi:double Clp-N motif-containing P-loop nucleoside triphosphate hydrolases superfamily protein [Actinidia rufa]|uniref:Double Clp-N motif-containing P-loop nucleoside triphosphate hydrolases superfamily protein n=1 Tax=Actinidia rufa TaxID=165716 RepID=A0A7J0EDH1_9ERIC|nr:double Clp-N motif-containing P-loop nucleoside triphosphate hydrolases superfamily protein [Actinidia rufa]
MPTSVTTARQCLTPEAARVLDEASAVARRRGHAQTTSLHAVSALLSLPSSPLRDACGRARNAAYSARAQFKALELCLGVSLDRLPSSPPPRDESPPAISNSLMAAIKRSQANQRRQPESFHLYQNQQQSSSVSMVKVELQNLVLSILDDPVVSRVFGEAGFRSSDIKLAILRPVHQLFRYSRYRGPPMFLCNLSGDSDLGSRGFSFPFLGFSGFSNGDENCRRIGEVLVKNKGRNPLLVGVCANDDSLQNFCEIVERRKGGCVLPVEIYGLSVIRIENDVSKFVNENCDDGLVKLRFREVDEMVKNCVGPGVVIGYGDLKQLVGDEASCSSASCVVGELTSLMESFVPFGGFFSTSSDLKSPLGVSNQCLSRCHLCNDKCEQEISSIAKGEFTPSVAEQYRSSLPSWLQMTELGTCGGLDVEVEELSEFLRKTRRCYGKKNETKSILRSCTAKGAATPKRVSFTLDLINGGVLSSCCAQGRRDGATTTRKVTYFTAHPGGGWGAPQWGGARHLGEKVQALQCGGAYTSVGSGVAR